MKNITESQAKSQNAFLEINATMNTHDKVLNFLLSYTKSILFVKAKSGKKFLVDMRGTHLNMLVIYDAITKEQLHEITSVNDAIDLFMKAKTDIKEITNSISSIFLDEKNMNYYLNDALCIQKKYGFNKIKDINITGDEYLNRTKILIQVAHDIMDKKLVPNIFDIIPIKKDKTFQENKIIPIFTNKIIDAAAYENYVEKHELMLCIIPHGTWDYDKHYDLSENVSKNRARLGITWVDGAKKIVPLIAKDFTVNDIITKTSYLKDSDVRPGCIYQEKSGSEYLYLGNINIISDITVKINKYTSLDIAHHYIRMTKKIQDIINKSKSFDEFLELYINSKVKDIYDNLPLSIRTNPRKFVQETATPFLNDTFSIVNAKNTNLDNLQYLIHVDTSNEKENGETCVNYAIIV